MPLEWSEERQSCADCRYTHVVAETPLGDLVIEWKDWKEHDCPTCLMPWGEHLVGATVADTKERVQTAWNAMAAKVAALV